LTAPHGLNGPVIMDATVPQHDGYRFVYTLPFGPRTVLVEDTYYSDGADLAPDILRARVFDYIAAQGWTVAVVLREEVGVLPIALNGDIAAFWDAGEVGVPVVGLRAALFNPITGYSFPDAVRVADLVAGLPDLTPAALYAALRHHSESTWAARKFYRFLNRMLFDAAEPAERYRVLQRFYRLDAALVRRFYAGRSTTWDMLRTMIGRPPVPLGRALGVLLKS
jgi:lycopene beta-cyclase